MLVWAVTFFSIAISAAVFGFTGIAVATAGIAQFLFGVFLALFVVALMAGMLRGRSRFAAESVTMTPTRRTPRALTVVTYGLIFAAALIGCDDDGGTRPGDVQGPRVSIVPSEATLETGQTLDFDVLIDGSASDAVIWSIVAEPAPGVLDQNGAYTAPDTVPSPPTVLIEAQSQAGIDQVGRAVVTIVPASTETLPNAPREGRLERR